MKRKYDRYMKICEALAEQAAARGNSAVGSLLVQNDHIIAEAEEATTTKEDVSCHAEMEAIRLARKKIGKDMSGTILISTKEPCVMCSYAIRYHRISKVIYKEKTYQIGDPQEAMDLLATDSVPPGWGPPVEKIQINT